MKLYDESELQASIEEGERKLAIARQRKRKTQRWALGGIVLLAVLIPLGVWAGVIAGQAPPTPLLVVTWPKDKVKQALASGETVLAREGQPFKVSVSNPENWEVSWRTGSVESRGSSIDWNPISAQDQLIGDCQPVAGGLKGMFSFLWPHRKVYLRCVEATNIPTPENGRMNQYTHVLSTGTEGAWVYPYIFAVGKVSWDERMLPLLASAVPAKSSIESQMADSSKKPTGPTWRIVSNFDGQSTEAATSGTFALLQGSDIKETMTQVATHIIRKSPNISLKFVVRLDRDPNEGIILLALDGKKQRNAWVRQKGQRAGAPLTGWENGKLGQMPLNLPPSRPR